MSLRLAEQVADAVLYEGYVLYPYRASAAKNRFRWQVGLVTPREYAEAVGSDPWFMQTECLAEAGAAAMLAVRVRCLHVQERAVEQAVDSDRSVWRAVDRLLVDGRQLVTWEEGVVCELVADALPLDGAPRDWCCPWTLDSAVDVETVRDGSERVAARIVRRRRAVVSTVRIATEPCGSLVKIRVRVENLSPCPAKTLAGRDAALRQSLAGTHTLLAVENGAFVSLLDPPPSASASAASCANAHTWPVLVGPAGSRTVMLSSPVILPDYPAIAPESPGDFCDATEIDEMLMLRVKTLTEEEKREARATDERAARIVDRADAASVQTMGRLHGAIRHGAAEAARDDDTGAPSASPAGAWEAFVNPPDAAPPEGGSLEIGSMRIGSGSRVRLMPTHRADSMDMCLEGRIATVTGVYRTLEDKPYVAVVLDDDPLGTSGSRYRRSLFFHPDEIVPLDRGAGGAE
ncbi:MAG: hypothetical protein ACRELC_00370 [Gemmatimonadota bacterium]